MGGSVAGEALVREGGVLGEGAQTAFARLNRLAVELLGVPVSLVSLVAEDRQVFAGQVGLPEPWASYGETPLSHSFCQHVVAADAPLLVVDAREHALVAGNLAIRDLGVVAYAGVPLRGLGGEAIGSLCAIDDRPRTWTCRDVAILEDLAGLAQGIIATHAPAARRDVDPVTGLVTRDALLGPVAAAARTPRAALIAIGLDGFGLINEALGRRAGDTVLRLVADRLSAAARGGDVVARLDGDEFLVLCDTVSDGPAALHLADRLIESITARAYLVAGAEQRVAATAGVFVVDRDVAADDAIDAAVHALRCRKGGQRTGAVLGRAAAGAALSLRNALTGAHERGEMSVHYQPVVDLVTGRPAKVEALLRWDRPGEGRVPTDRFIDLAERSGEIVPIGEWVLRRACEDLAAWRAAIPGLDLKVAVNVAPQQMTVAGLPATVAATLDGAGLEPGAIMLELTERTLLDDRLSHRTTIAALHALGVGFALDDFGTGYSALGYLTKFPIDILKIDRLFVDGVDVDPQRHALVRAIVDMAHALGLRTVAEGIERPEQVAALRELGCDLGQGYLLGRPRPAPETLALLTG